LLEAHQLESLYGLRLDRAPLLVTFHPVTLDYERTEWHIAELLSALDNFDMPIVFSLPNSDTGGRVIISEIKNFVSSHSSAQMVDSLGTQGYFSLMSLAAAMVGNSSSGIIEAPSFNLPVVNIGSRQEGRIRAENVIDVGYESEAIVKGVKRAIQPEFRQKLKGLHNPYGTGYAAEKIVKRLKKVELDEKVIIKRFYDVNVVLPGGASH
jgi:UDP-N-acetylglucosamine 2-epimerase (non-hydrolysing)/GDP/UDP-N,N'-diacetylbacillosamine 2-epimerase (hydrolysing)